MFVGKTCRLLSRELKVSRFVDVVVKDEQQDIYNVYQVGAGKFIVLPPNNVCWIRFVGCVDKI